MSTKRKIYMYTLVYKMAPKYEIVTSFNKREIQRWYNDDLKYKKKSTIFQDISPIETTFISIPLKSNKKVKK